MLFTLGLGSFTGLFGSVIAVETYADTVAEDGRPSNDKDAAATEAEEANMAEDELIDVADDDDDDEDEDDPLVIDEDKILGSGAGAATAGSDSVNGGDTPSEGNQACIL